LSDTIHADTIDKELDTTDLFFKDFFSKKPLGFSIDYDNGYRDAAFDMWNMMNDKIADGEG